MKKITGLVICLVLSLTLFTDSHAQSEAKIKRKIEAMAKEMSEQMVKGVYITKYYADDAISLPNWQPMLEGIDAIKANAETNKNAGLQFTKFQLTPYKITKYDDIVTEIGSYELSLTIPEVPQPVVDKGKYVNVWQIQKNGDLKILVDAWNTDVDPMAPQ